MQHSEQLKQPNAFLTYSVAGFVFWISNSSQQTGCTFDLVDNRYW